MLDTSGIHRLVGRARRRLKLQSALEAATLALVIIPLLALAAVYGFRHYWIAESTWLAVLGGCGAGIVLAAAVGYARRFPTPLVATLIDRASNLSDRLASACEFEQRLSKLDFAEDVETAAMMRAAIEDAVRSAAKADVRAATPFALPAKARTAGLMIAACAAATALIQSPQRAPVIHAVRPALGAPGTTIELTGLRLCGFRDSDVNGGADSVDGTCRRAPRGAVVFGPVDATAETWQEAPIVSWRHRSIEVKVPIDAPIGPTYIRVQRNGDWSEPIAFEVVDKTDERIRPDDAVRFEDDDLEFHRDLLQDLRQTAQDTSDQHLEEFVKEVEELLEAADRGELTKQELLEKLSNAEKQYMEGADENVDQQIDELKKTGQELKKDAMTRELGKALEQGDLDKAQQEMEKLAQKLEKGELSDKQEQKLAKTLQDAAEKFEKRQEKKDAALDRQIENKKRELERLSKKANEETNDKKKDELQRRQKREENELKKLTREKQQREKSRTRQELKSLHRNMKQAAGDMKKQPGSSQQQRRKFAAQNMRNASRNTGNAQQEQRKVTNQKKVASQLSDLKEAMRRAKRKGNGPRDRFGKNQRNSDFRRRARGQQGNRGAWRPGSTSGKGAGQGGPGQTAGNGQPGPGSGQGGSNYGTGDGGDPLGGDPTGKGGHIKDKDLQGDQGKGGMSTRETILSAAQKGFSSQSYQKVFKKYTTVVEEVIKAEKVPSGYKYYVKKYFQKIKPHAM